MFKFLAAALLALVLPGCVTMAPEPPKSFQVDLETIQIVGILDENLMSEPLAQLQHVPVGGTVKIFIGSRAGDPRVAPKFLEAMKNKTTVCFATVAGGGAFTIFQACTIRVVGTKATLGSGKYQINGTTGNAEKDAQMHKDVAEYATNAAELEADRLGLSATDYDALLSKGFAWYGPKAILENKGADAVVDFSCSQTAVLDTMVRYVANGADLLRLVMTVCPVPRQLLEPRIDMPDQLGEFIGIPLWPADPT